MTTLYRISYAIMFSPFFVICIRGIGLGEASSSL